MKILKYQIISIFINYKTMKSKAKLCFLNFQSEAT